MSSAVCVLVESRSHECGLYLARRWAVVLLLLFTVVVVAAYPMSQSTVAAFTAYALLRLLHVRTCIMTSNTH
jgi:hypothetical protein